MITSQHSHPGGRIPCRAPPVHPFTCTHTLTVQHRAQFEVQYLYHVHCLVFWTPQEWLLASKLWNKLCLWKASMWVNFLQCWPMSVLYLNHPTLQLLPPLTAFILNQPTALLRLIQTCKIWNCHVKPSLTCLSHCTRSMSLFWRRFGTKMALGFIRGTPVSSVNMCLCICQTILHGWSIKIWGSPPDIKVYLVGLHWTWGTLKKHWNATSWADGLLL